MDNRKGEWIETFTGKKFYPFDPRPEDVCIKDIAHALSMLCRFGGHCKQFYSVAQHSVILSRNVSPESRLRGLLDDASEAYIVDVPRPIKKDPSFAVYRQVESTIMKAICNKFGLPPDAPEEVSIADKRMLTTEHHQFMCNGSGWASDYYPPFDVQLIPWSPEVAELTFLNLFYLLSEKERNHGWRRGNWCN